ncbi:MAG: hypothetical protein OHK0047_08080 [Leptolyngbyaceae cyanobacterium]
MIRISNPTLLNGRYHGRVLVSQYPGQIMARYTGFFKVAASVNNFQQLLSELLESCNFNIIYQAGDYLMAREIPGKVAYHQLVTVEVLVDKTMATNQEVQMNFVIKNEELPLQVDNHCYQVFNQVNQAVQDASCWKLIEVAAS